jgi:ribose/xylose/arabinose/galactoside ABC-type transport system permease subunit
VTTINEKKAIVTDSVGTAVQQRPRWRNGVVGLFAAWLLVIVVTAAFHLDFLSERTVLAVGFTMAITGILAVGQSIITISGAILDLSIPAALLFPAWICARLVSAHSPLPLAIVVLICIAVGVAWGLLNAAIVTRLKINPIIVTLGTNFIGIAFLTTQFDSASVPNESLLGSFANGHTLGIPNITWVMVLAVVIGAQFIARTRPGRHVIATGGSVVGARARGISIVRVRLLAFGVAGACYGIAGVLFAETNNGFAPADGNVYLLAVIAAVILAGIRLDGGHGNLFLLLPSVGLLATVQTALVFFGLNTAMQMVFQGAVLVVALAADGYLRRRSAR